MHRYNARQTSTIFADEPASPKAGVPTPPFPSLNDGSACHDSSIAAAAATVAAAAAADCLDHAGAEQTISVFSSPDGSGKLNTIVTKHTNTNTNNSNVCGCSGGSGGSGGSGSSNASTIGVTESCRSCIDDSCKEQERESFLLQKCPMSMAWVKIAGDAPSTMATFEENAAHSLHPSSPVANLESIISHGSFAEGSRRHRPSGGGGDSDGDVAGTHADSEAVTSRNDSAPVEGVEASCVMPPPRFGHTAVLYKDAEIIVFGGKANDEHYFNDVYAYEVEQRQWTRLQEEQTEESAVEGANMHHGTSAAPAAASLDSTRVSPLPISATHRALHPCGRVGHAAALYQNTMYIVSGERQGHFYDDMWALDVPSLTWTMECGLPFSPRKGHTMHLLPADYTATRARDDMFVVFGGLVKASRLYPRPADPELPARNAGEPDMMCAPTNETLLYYPTQRRWCQLKTCGDIPTPRFYHVAQLVTGTSLLLLFGGRTVAPAPVGAASDGTFMNDLHLLDVSTGMWRHIRDAAGDVPSPRMCAASVFVNGVFGVFAGGGDGYCRNAYEYQLSANRWRRLVPNNQPACSRPTVTYVKDRLVLFGGFAPRMGVLNCTMELSLAPLSLKNQCLLWWNRCAFEKHLRTCALSRQLGQEERATATAATAAMRCCKRGAQCGKQVTLRRSPANLSCSPLPTPRSSVMKRGTRRPTPFQSPGYDRAASWNASTTALQGGGAAWYDVWPGSPSPSYPPSSPVVCSPLSGASQSMPSWHESALATSIVPSVGAAGMLHLSSMAAASSYAFHGSPTTVATGAAAAGAAPASAMRPVSAFPSRPETAASSGLSTHAPSTLPNTTTTGSPLSHTSQWYRSGSVGAGAPPEASYANTAAYPGGMPPPQQQHQQCAIAVRAWTDSFQRNSSHSSASGATPLSSTPASATHRVAATTQVDGGSTPCTPATAAMAARESIKCSCHIASCMRNITGLVATTFPRFYTCQPPQAMPRVTNVKNSTANNGIGVGNSPGVNTASPASHPLRIDVNARTPPSPQVAETSTGYPLSSPMAYCGCMTAAVTCSRLPSPSSPPQQQQQQQPYRPMSARFTESESSRASSVHSARSTSSEAVPLSRVKQLIRQLEGPNGPVLFRALAMQMRKQSQE